VNRKDFQDLADVRIAEAQSLFTGGFFDGAYYLAGYAIECALKACIAKTTQQFDFPSKDAGKCYTHKINDLARLVTGLEADLKAASTADIDLGANWSTVIPWNEESRYARKSQQDAEDLIQAITDISHGVLPWLKGRW
jgi:hypothetical protein